jgi:hypothetical protein
MKCQFKNLNCPFVHKTDDEYKYSKEERAKNLKDEVSIDDLINALGTDKEEEVFSKYENDSPLVLSAPEKEKSPSVEVDVVLPKVADVRLVAPYDSDFDRLGKWFPKIDVGTEYHNQAFFMNLLFCLKHKFGLVHDCITDNRRLCDIIDGESLVLTLQPSEVNLTKTWGKDDSWSEKISRIVEKGEVMYRLVHTDPFNTVCDIRVRIHDVYLQVLTISGVVYYYTVVSKFGPYEVGRLSRDPPQRFVSYFTRPTIIIESNRLIGNGRDCGVLSWLRDKVLGAKIKYEKILVEIPVGLYQKLTIIAMGNEKRDSLFMELKAAASRWRIDPSNHSCIDDKTFMEILPHAISHAMYESILDEVGASHHCWAAEKMNPLTRYDTSRIYSRVPLVFTILGTAISTGVGALFSQFGKLLATIKEKMGFGNTSLIVHKSVCVRDIDGYRRLLDAVPVSTVTEIKELTVNGVTLPAYSLIAPKITKIDNGCTCNRTAKCRYNSFYTVEGLVYYDFCQCQSNLESGLRQRYFKPTLPQQDDMWVKVLPFILKNIDKYSAGEKAVYDFEGWLETRPYPLAKKRLIREAMLHTDITRFDDDESRIFVKSELQLFLAESPKFLKPRIIFEKSAYNLGRLGPWMKGVSEVLSRNMDGVKSDVVYACGLDKVQLGLKYDKMVADIGSNAFYYESDLIMCETSMQGRMQWVENLFYEKLGVDPLVMNALFGKTFTTGGSRGGTIRYKMRSMKESGTSNTTGGNTIVHSMIVLSVLDYYNSINPGNKLRYKFLVGSDDSLIITNQPISVCAQFIRDMGLNPEIFDRTRNKESARFYSGRFVPYLITDKTTGAQSIQSVHTPLLGKAFARGGSSKIDHDPDTYLLRSLNSRCAEYSATPILRQVIIWAESYLKGNQKSKKKINDNNCWRWPEHNFKLQSIDATDATIARSYGINIQDLRDLESRISGFLNSRTPGTFSDEVLLDMLRIDLA